MKKEEIPVVKNEEYNIEIHGMGHDGEGVGKIKDFTVFVPEAIVGESVRIKIVKINKNFAFGKLLEIIKPSKDRVEPACSINKRCGGCQLQHLSYAGQLAFKTQKVKDAMSRIGKLEGINVHDTMGMETPYRYRNKVQLPVGMENGIAKIGFYAARSHEIVDMKSCSIQDEKADLIVELIRGWIETYKIKTYNEVENTGVLRHIMVRTGFKSGEVMVVLVTHSNNLPHKEELIESLAKNIVGITSIIQNINENRTNTILGLKCKTLWGQDNIVDYIGKFKFNISPLSFFQVNPIQTKKLYDKALEYAGLTGNEVVFDAYCGTGTISLFLSQKAKKVYGVEIIQEAIDNAIENAKENKVENVEFLVGESEKIIPKLIEQGIIADVVVVDPPRKGCERILLEEIAKMGPKRIVYVSCDTATLARDLDILNGLNYETVEVQPVDMFPQTGHVEAVVKLERR